MTELERVDPEIYAALRKEAERQEHNLQLIASENVVSRAMLEAQGSILANKYAAGYPGRPYHGGGRFVDVAEQLATDRPRGCSRPSTSTCSHISHFPGAAGRG
jgi:glycine hydroxymethyltransferase